MGGHANDGRSRLACYSVNIIILNGMPREFARGNRVKESFKEFKLAKQWGTHIVSPIWLQQVYFNVYCLLNIYKSATIVMLPLVAN